jgi:hypothetical protein
MHSTVSSRAEPEFALRIGNETEKALMLSHEGFAAGNCLKLLARGSLA